MPSTIFPHAEERSGVAGARLKARTAPDAAHSCPASQRIPPLTEAGKCCFVVRHRLGQRDSISERKRADKTTAKQEDCRKAIIANRRNKLRFCALRLLTVTLQK